MYRMYQALCGPLPSAPGLKLTWNPPTEKGGDHGKAMMVKRFLYGEVVSLDRVVQGTRRMIRSAFKPGKLLF